MNFIFGGRKAPLVIQAHWAEAESQADTRGATKDNMQPPSPNDNRACEDIDLEEMPMPPPTRHQDLPLTSDINMPLASPTWESNYKSSHVEHDRSRGVDPSSNINQTYLALSMP